MYKKPRTMRRFASLYILVLSLLLAAPSGTAMAAQASQWTQVLHSQARIVRGIMHDDGAIEVGIQVKLDAGWKTYWRVPGDAGVPPEFDWSQSRNIADVNLLWPAPVRFRDIFGESIGYLDEVVFPVVVRPGDWTKPSVVKVTVHYAVCKDICAPVRADLVLDLPLQSSTPLFAAVIARYKAMVPKPPEQVTGLRVANVSVLRADKDVHLLVDVICEDPARRMDVFIEGPKRLYFATPKAERAPVAGQKRFRIRIDGVGEGETLSGERLSFVVVDGDKRLAQDWRLQ